MPNAKISADPAVTVLNDADILPIIQSATNKKVTIAQFIELLDLARYGRTSTVIDRLIDFNGNTVSGNTEVVSWANLVATYPAASNTGMSVLVTNAGNNTIGVPCTAWSNGVEWLVVNGEAMLTTTAPAMKFITPAATFTGTYTFSQGATAQETVITTSGVNYNGLTSGAAVNCYIAITGSTSGGGIVSWAIGFYKITNIVTSTVGLSITVLRDYVATLGQPTIVLAGTEFEVLRVHLPPLTDTGSFRWLLCTENTGTSAKNTRIKLGAAAAAIGSTTEIFQHSDTTATTLMGVGGLFNTGGATNTNTTLANGTQATTGSATGNPISPNIQTNVTTDIVVTMQITTSNDIIELRRATFWWTP